MRGLKKFLKNMLSLSPKTLIVINLVLMVMNLFSYRVSGDTSLLWIAGAQLVLVFMLAIVDIMNSEIVLAFIKKKYTERALGEFDKLNEMDEKSKEIIKKLEGEI
jgi:hypothetical protein